MARDARRSDAKRARRKQRQARAGRSHRPTGLVRVPFWEFPDVIDQMTRKDPTLTFEDASVALYSLPIQTGPPGGPYEMTSFEEWRSEWAGESLKEFLTLLLDAHLIGALTWDADALAYELRSPPSTI